VIDSAVEMVAVEGGGIMDRMLALGDDREKGLVLYQAVENLMYLREKYRVNTELLDFIRIEQEMGNSLIDMVMMKRLRMVMDYGFQEGGGDGSGG
jgi:hypothetical protein